MDSLITAAGRSLAAGDPLGALALVSLREDAAALALRGTAMAQLGDLARARELLRRAARAFGPGEPIARARCHVAEAEIALVLRDIGAPMDRLADARATLAKRGDRGNAAHAGYLMARRLLLIGRLDEAQAILEGMEVAALPTASRAGAWLVAAGIATRRIETGPARAALDRAAAAAEAAAIAAVIAEVAQAVRTFEAPAARLLERGGTRLLGLPEVEAVMGSDALVIDALRGMVRNGPVTVPLGGRPVLFTLVLALAEAWPSDVSREALLIRAFRARHADESHRARLRVEIGRLRSAISELADIRATENGFILRPKATSMVVLSPPQEDDHGDVLALLADGEAWSSSALALALDVSPRTVQRALDALAAAGKVESFGRGRACRWTARQLIGFPTVLLHPAPLPAG